MDLITQMPDGKYVKNTLYMKNPLKAGEMQIIKVKLNDEGGVVTENPEVGVSVELDWKPGAILILKFDDVTAESSGIIYVSKIKKIHVQT